MWPWVRGWDAEGSQAAHGRFSKGSLKNQTSNCWTLEHDSTRLWLLDNEMGYSVNISECVHPNEHLSSQAVIRDAGYLSQDCDHCFRHFGGSLENLLQIDATLFGISTIVADFHPAMLDFIFGNSQEAFWHLQPSPVNNQLIELVMLFWVQIEAWLIWCHVLVWCGNRLPRSFWMKMPCTAGPGTWPCRSPYQEDSTNLGGQCLLGSLVVKQQKTLPNSGDKDLVLQVIGQLLLQSGSQRKRLRSAAEESRIPPQKSSEAAAKTMKFQTIPP